jgi:hypothetical protein
MLISERDAARRLAAVGLSLSATQQLLATGIGGPPVRTRVATLYDEERIEELVSRPHVRADEFDRAFPVGVVIARLPRHRTFDVNGEWDEHARVMSGPWRIPVRNRMYVAITVRRAPGYPLLLSVAGHILGGASIVGCNGAGDGGLVSFDVRPAGDSLASLIGRRLRGHRGPQVELVGWTAKAASGALVDGSPDPSTRALGVDVRTSTSGDSVAGDVTPADVADGLR